MGGEVTAVVGAHEYVRRLHEMGVQCGAWIEMVSSGSPCIVRVLGSQLCFSEAQTLGILVRPEELR
jgi:Fe2+ transport system protein FeoA